MVGLIDCDNFFCSCERVFRPDLAKVPLVVLSNNDGCVVARSKEVKEMGIPEGMPYYQLKEKYPDAGIVAFSSNYALYGDMSARIVSILREEAPDVIQYSIDESFLDLRGMEQMDLHKWGVNLCRKILKGTGMPVSLGIAQSNTLAKMASKYAKKYAGYNKCCIIGTDEQRVKALRLFPVGDVWGIGRRISRNLGLIGVSSAYDFATLPVDYVRRRFHVTGERTWKELNGIPCTLVDGLDTVSKKTIVTSRSFPGMIQDIADLRSHIANYAARCAVKLRRQNSVCSMVTAFIQSNHFREDLIQYDNSGFYSFSTPTNTTNEIVDVATHILDTIYRKGIYYKRAGIMVSGITTAKAIQPDLFEYSPERSKKYSDISEALDKINGRLGADTVVLGAQQYREKSTDGKSVKFVNAIRRAMKSPDYSTQLGAFQVG
ncbi:MAG: Y-family DNA polymerase [Duncaniella sp.]|nr:Y-family DNA polymerase [Muribaculum sp.]MCM1255509.1 Y-family DNA polymerase [Duncaniella sp.]